MGYSRITLATLLALGLAAPIYDLVAAEQPFLVELKGPDDPLKQGRSPLPLLTNSVAPIINHTAVKPIVSRRGHSSRYGPVRSADTLWSLASRFRPARSVTVYQTMVAIYEKNQQSFADGNINHILVGSYIVLPSAVEAKKIPDGLARMRFAHDNESWKALGPQYLASRLQLEAKPAPTTTDPLTAPLPTRNTSVSGAQATTALPAASAAAAIGALATTATAETSGAITVAAPINPPQPLPSTIDKPQIKSATELSGALEEVQTQLLQMGEMNHRLKLRLQELTEEVAALKSDKQEKQQLQKEIASLKANVQPPVVSETQRSWWTELLASPLNLAMIILLPILAVLAFVTRWLRARTRQELEEQSLAEAGTILPDAEPSEFEALLSESADATITEQVPLPLSLSLSLADEAKPAHDQHAFALDVPAFDETGADVTDEHGLFDGLNEHSDEAGFDLPEQHEFDSQSTPLSQSELGLDLAEPMLRASVPPSDVTPWGPADELMSAQDVDAMLAELDLEQDFNDLADGLDKPADLPATAQFVDQPSPALTPWPDEVEHAVEPPPSYVEIDTLLAQANASSAQDEPYQGLSLDVGLDEFPEVLPKSAGVDVDVDEGGVGAMLDLARAYLEIDDKESASSLLQDAALQGSAEQRAEAKKLLARIS